jgi:hypothetical protein
VLWIDHASIRVGDPLADSIQQAISEATNLVLLWSAPARESRYVKFDWQAAIHLEKPVIPCRLDDVELPLFLQTILNCDFRSSYAEGLHKLVDALGGIIVPPRPQPREQSAALFKVALAVTDAQRAVLNALVQHGPNPASQIQVQLDPVMDRALELGPQDPLLLNLAGYHKKNSYMIKHWAAVHARKAPQDDLLAESEKFFYSALSIRPDDPSALNGLVAFLCCAAT